MNEQTHIGNLIWLDLEMTGLDPERNRIIEIATVVTNSALEVVAEGPNIAIFQNESILSAMDEWNVNQHNKSGLIERVKTSHYSEEMAQAETLEFLKKYVRPDASPLCGNSVHMDRKFLDRYMPKLAGYFHYRNLDVSTPKIIAKMWYPGVLKGLEKASRHRALDDVYDSIDELKYYREHILR